MKRFGLLLLAGLLVAASSDADAACIRSRSFNLTSEGPWPGYGTIDQGKTCTGNFTAGGTWIFKRLYLVQAPSRGKVRLQEGGTYFYTAPVGYSGNDDFTLRVCGIQGGMEGCANLINHMTVR
jgi:Bacterial Ig domain